mmetsp:Transcript_12439/g.31407  ORF Transcript_12439/g.31407 Transcript_12439/m.31407 type:complete len:249 (-) Transcript_12439:202-948(-)
MSVQEPAWPLRALHPSIPAPQLLSFCLVQFAQVLVRLRTLGMLSFSQPLLRACRLRLHIGVETELQEQLTQHLRETLAAEQLPCNGFFGQVVRHFHRRHLVELSRLRTQMLRVGCQCCQIVLIGGYLRPEHAGGIPQHLGPRLLAREEAQGDEVDAPPHRENQHVRWLGLGDLHFFYHDRVSLRSFDGYASALSLAAKLHRAHLHLCASDRLQAFAPPVPAAPGCRQGQQQACRTHKGGHPERGTFSR